MRTIDEVKTNIAAINAAMATIKKQVSLLEEEYQPNAEEITGERVGSWDDMIENLNQAWQDMNTMSHMEIDRVDLLKHGDNE